MGAEQSLEQADPANASPFSRLLPKSTMPGRPDGVVVVSGPNGQGSFGQTELDKLAKIPLFSPFIKSSVNLFGFDSNSIDGTSSSTAMGSSSSAGLSQTPPMLDSRAIASISTRLQEHLRQCAEAVSFDQNALCTRMNEIDLSIAASHSCLSERHRRYNRLSDQLTQLKDTCALASKVKAGVEQTHRGIMEMNALLPIDLRVEIPELPVPTQEESSNRSHSSSIEVPEKQQHEVKVETVASSASSSASSHAHFGDETRPVSMTAPVIKEEGNDVETSDIKETSGESQQ